MLEIQQPRRDLLDLIIEKVQETQRLQADDSIRNLCVQ
jgi:hypothetical protein